jgi:TRAP transporter TAXI family solute receptor
VLGAGILLSGALVGCTPAPPPVAHLVIAGGAAGDVSSALAAGLADAARAAWSVPVEVLETKGSTENLQEIARGRADVAFATVDAAVAAHDGEVPFNGTVGIAALAGLYDEYLHLVVRADSDLRTLADLPGHRIATGSVGSVSNALVDRLLQVARLGAVDPPRQDLTPADAARALMAKEIDGFAVTGGVPLPLLADLAERLPIRLIPLGAEVAAVQNGYGERYLARVVPARMYGLETETPTVGVRAVLVVRANLPQETAFALTRLLFDAKDRLDTRHPEARRLDPRSALDTGTVPLHAGAARYYRETKLMV